MVRFETAPRLRGWDAKNYSGVPRELSVRWLRGPSKDDQCHASRRVSDAAPPRSGHRPRNGKRKKAVQAPRGRAPTGAKSR